MKNKVIFLFLPAILLSGCFQKDSLFERDKVYIAKRNLVYSDVDIKVKPVFVSLPAGAVSPEGWLRDWAEAAADGITGHLDEWTAVYGMGWKGVGFEAVGADPKNGTGWPLEQCSYWLDGAVRLAYILNDSALINKISNRLNGVVDGVLNTPDARSFVWWVPEIDFLHHNFNCWAHSHMGRALVAYYEATGNPRILEALTKVYRHFDAQPLPWSVGDVTGACNLDPMNAVYELSGDNEVLANICRIAADSLTQDAITRWNKGDFASGHGVITYENLRLPAMVYPVTNNPAHLTASLKYLEWLDSNHLLPYDIASSEENVAGIGSTRNTETCNVACAPYTYQQLLELTGDGRLADRIERVFFNAGPAPVARDFKTMSYYQAPDRIEHLMPSETPGHPGTGCFDFKNTGHTVLCCVGNLNRVIPNFIMHQWLGTSDKGLAASLYAPSTLNGVVGDGIPVEIKTVTDYPFEESIRMTVNPASKSLFPLYLRVPSWCKNPLIKVNDKEVNIVANNGFLRIARQWTAGDSIELYFPMNIKVTDGRETPYPEQDYFVKGASAGRALAPIRDVNSPYRTVSYGPLLFALPVADINPNKMDTSAAWNYALVSANSQDYIVERSQMPSHWSWQIAEAPIRLKARAVSFDWNPTPILPLPKEYIIDGEETQITLIPYGCTKFRISMFPIAAKAE
jgi:hypothetical protein